MKEAWKAKRRQKQGYEKEIADTYFQKTEEVPDCQAGRGKDKGFAAYLDKLTDLYRADGEMSLKYGHSEGYAAYFTDVKDDIKLFPCIAYAKFDDFNFTYTVMSIMGETLEVPALVFRTIWVTKRREVLECGDDGDRDAR